MSISLTIEDTKIKNKKYYYLDEVNSTSDPIVSFNRELSKYYTICMIDTNIARANIYNKTEWLHWLVVNNDEIIMPYSPPTPPKGSGTHKYYVCVYEQKKPLDIDKMQDMQNNRFNFSMEVFMRENDLKCTGCIMFRTANPSAEPDSIDDESNSTSSDICRK